VQVRSGDPPGCAHQADRFPRRDFLAGFHIDAAQVTVHGDDALAVVEEHRVAVEEEVTDLEDAARRRRLNRRTRGGRNVHPTVWISGLAVEEPPQAETARALARHRGPHGELRDPVGRIRAEGGVDAHTLAGDALEVLCGRIDLTLVLYRQALLGVLLFGYRELEAPRLALGGHETSHIPAGQGIERNANDRDPATGHRQHR
jgi:hypothetical protein